MTTPRIAVLSAIFLISLAFTAAIPGSAMASYSDAGFHAGAEGLNASERAGREIWYKATAGNDAQAFFLCQKNGHTIIRNHVVQQGQYGV